MNARAKAGKAACGEANLQANLQDIAILTGSQLLLSSEYSACEPVCLLHHHSSHADQALRKPTCRTLRSSQAAR